MASGGSGVIGYQPVNISFTDKYWGGLEHNNQVCLLDGSVGEGIDETWWYAMGSFQNFKGGIPGPSYPVVHQVDILTILCISTLLTWIYIDVREGVKKTSLFYGQAD